MNAPIHDGDRTSRYDCGCPRGHGELPLPTCTDPICVSMLADYYSPGVGVMDVAHVTQYGSRAAAIIPSDEVLLAQRDRLRRALKRLLAAYPRLAWELADGEQQRAYRVAVCAAEECG